MQLSSVSLCEVDDFWGGLKYFSLFFIFTHISVGHSFWFFSNALKTPLRWRFCHSSRDTTGRVHQRSATEDSSPVQPLVIDTFWGTPTKIKREMHGKHILATFLLQRCLRKKRLNLKSYITRFSSLFWPSESIFVCHLCGLWPFLWAYMVFFLPCPTRHRPSKLL